MAAVADYRLFRLCVASTALLLLTLAAAGYPSRAFQPPEPAEPAGAAVLPAPEPDEGEREERDSAPPAQPDRPVAEAPAIWPPDSGAEQAATPEASGRFWPDLDGPALNWFALIVVLLIGFHARPLLSCRNFSVVVLALTCLLFPLRSESYELGLGGFSRPAEWWAVLLLSLAALYWLMRGIGLVFRGPSPAVLNNLSGSALLVVLAAGLAISAHRIATAPLTEGAKDALIGGVYTAETGRLPYGEIGSHDRRAPLLYLLYAGCVRLIDPELEDSDGVTIPLNWSNRELWQDEDWASSVSLGPARLANALLFALLLIGLFSIGRGLHSREAGAALVVLFCVYPGVWECLPRPELTLPAALLTWVIAFLLVPGFGGLLATLTLVLAGTVTPWAWLGLPLLLAFYLRRSAAGALGSVVGLVGGVAGAAYLLMMLTVATWPYADRAYAAAGVAPAQKALGLEESGELRTELSSAAQPTRQALTAPLWRWLLCEDDVLVADDQRAALGPYYRDWYDRQDWQCRARMALRTVLEATWLSPSIVPASADTSTRSAWEYWRNAGCWTAEREQTIRRIAKLILGLIVLGLAAAIFIGRPIHPGVLIGALLVVTSGVLLVSESGAVTNWIWLIPVILSAEALVKPETETAARGTSRRSTSHPYLGPEPRITIER